MNFKLLLKYPSMEIMDLLEYKDMTVKEIMDKLEDVPKASLYRHINKMFEANFIKISKTKIINGLIQKTYSLNNKLMITEDDFKNITDKERTRIYLKNFMAFIKSIIKLFRKNTYNGNFSVTFIKFKMNLTKDEGKEMYEKITNILTEYQKNKPTKDRTLQEVSLVYQDVDSKEE